MSKSGQISKELKKLLDSKKGIRLDVGCGAAKQEGFVGIDIRELPGVDIVHDLEEFPFPLPDDSVNFAVASHVLEHINPAKGIFLNFMNEMWRIMQVNAEFMISVPYAGSPGFWQDPTHVNGINDTTFRYFDPLDEPTNGQLYKIYQPKPWKIKFQAYQHHGNLEVVLIKRAEDPSYYG